MNKTTSPLKKSSTIKGKGMSNTKIVNRVTKQKSADMSPSKLITN